MITPLKEVRGNTIHINGNNYTGLVKPHGSEHGFDQKKMLEVDMRRNRKALVEIEEELEEAEDYNRRQHLKAERDSIEKNLKIIQSQL